MIDLTELPVFISVPRAALVLGFSRATTYRMVDDEDLPCRRIGGRIWIESALLPEFIKQIGLADARTDSEESYAA